MQSHTVPFETTTLHPVRLRILPALSARSRLTVAFRWLLAIPQMIIVGSPIALAMTWAQTPDGHVRYLWGAGGGALGAVALLCALVGWFAIIFTGRTPDGLTKLAAYYLRWHVRVSEYVALLRDEYPPFGEGTYPVDVELPVVMGERDRVAIAFRPILMIPQVCAVWLVGFAWGIATIFAWFAILFTGRYPKGLYEFGVGALRWATRVEAYVLLLTDDYPPFSLE
jgi:hypothetical protein